MRVRWPGILSLALAIIALGLLAGFLSSAAGEGAATPAEYLPTPRPAEPCDTCEPNNGLSQACGPLAPGRDYQFFIRCTAAPDDDLYYIDLESPARIFVDLTSIPRGTDYDLYVIDEHQVERCRSIQPWNLDEHLTCDLDQAGRYYIRVYPAEGCNESDPYTLTVTYPTPPPTPTPFPTPTPPCNVHIDDFSDTNPYNDLNKPPGNPSGWKVDPPGCDNGTFHVTYTRFDLQLDYDLTATAGCTARYTTTLLLDAAPYQVLSLRMKSDTAQELARVVIGLRDQAGHEMKVKAADFLNQVFTSTWQAVNVPLAVFSTQVQTSTLDLFFVEVAGTQGRIYLDSLRLEKPLVPLTVDNFNDRADPNALGGGAVITTSTPTATIEIAYAASGTYDDSPGGYVISYTVPSGTWGIWETDLVGLDVSDYAFLSFYVRGASGGEKVNLYLTDGGDRKPPADVEAYAPGGAIRTGWSLVRVPLRAFQGVDLTDLAKIQFVFEWEPMTGTIFLDDLRFIASSLLVDDFCDDDENNSLNDIVSNFTSASPYTGVVTRSMPAGTLRLDYDVTAGPGSYSGYYSWTRLDLTPYRSLVARVRSERCGQSGAISARTVTTPTDKIPVSDYLLDGITDQWQEARIPLAASSVVTDWAPGDSYVIAFEAWRGAPRGTTWWDDVGFETACAPLWVDNFNDEDHINALGGSWGVYPPEAQITNTTFITQAYGDAGAGLVVSYTVPAGKWAIWGTELRNVDVSNYGSLTFQVKGVRGGEKPNIYLIDCDGKRKVVRIEDYVNISTEWQTAIIGLSHFGDLALTCIHALEVVIEPTDTGVKGTFFLDNIRFLPSADCSRKQVFLPLAARGYTPSPPLHPVWDFESDTEGWNHYITYTPSLAVIDVQTSTFKSRWRNASLAMIVNLIGGDASYSKGVAYIDLEKHPPAGVTAPLDLSCKPVSCWLYVPACGLGDPAEPSYVRFRVQDADENREYGARTPVVRNQWFEFVLRPSTVAPLGGSMDPGFDPHRIVKVEVEFGTRAQGITYRGKVYLDACGWQEIDP